MAEVLGWDEERIAQEVALYRGRVDAERRSQEQPDDEAADRIRRSVPDPYAALATLGGPPLRSYGTRDRCARRIRRSSSAAVMNR